MKVLLTLVLLGQSSDLEVLTTDLILRFIRTMTSKSVCFDVLGTCFGFDLAISVIEQRIGQKLKPVKVDSKSLFFSWFYAGQRDFTYNSIVGNYIPIAQILKKTFRRACLIVDLPANDVTDDDVEGEHEMKRKGKLY